VQMLNLVFHDQSMLTRIIIISFLLISLPSETQVYNNRPTPNDFFKYHFEDLGFSSSNNPGVFLIGLVKIFSTPQNDPNYIRPYPLILDRNGYILWYAKPQIRNISTFEYEPVSKRFAFSYFSQGEQPVAILDSNLNYIDTLNSIGVTRDGHDFRFSASSTYLIATMYIDTMDLSAYTFDGSPGSTNELVRGFGVQEQDAVGNILFEWNSNDHIHPSEMSPFWGYPQPELDYAHGNSIEEDSDGHLILSMRHLNAVYKINRQTGDIIWQLGGVNSDFVFVNDAGFSAQHDARVLPNGHLSVFDNGNESNPQVSRGVVYELDTMNWIATKQEEYVFPNGLVYGPAMGSFRKYDDFTLTGFGRIFRPEPSVMMTDEQGNLLGSISFEDSVMCYRVTYAEPDLPERPEISCEWNGTHWELVAPNSAEYFWSTGEQTQSIVINQADTFQVWIPQGAGYLGSEPYIISDPSNPCLLEATELQNTTTLSFRLFDLLGREIDKVVPNLPYLKVFSNGKVERYMKFEN